MTLAVYLKSFIVLATAMTLVACAGDPTPRSTAQYNQDASINTNVHAAVIGVPGVHANNVKVTTYDGVVKLDGIVENAVAAQNAVQAARQVAGVKKVDFDLKVEQP